MIWAMMIVASVAGPVAYGGNPEQTASGVEDTDTPVDDAAAPGRPSRASNHPADAFVSVSRGREASIDGPSRHTRAMTALAEACEATADRLGRHEAIAATALQFRLDDAKLDPATSDLARVVEMTSALGATWRTGALPSHDRFAAWIASMEALAEVPLRGADDRARTACVLASIEAMRVAAIPPGPIAQAWRDGAAAWVPLAAAVARRIVGAGRPWWSSATRRLDEGMEPVAALRLATAEAWSDPVAVVDTEVGRTVRLGVIGCLRELVMHHPVPDVVEEAAAVLTSLAAEQQAMPEVQTALLAAVRGPWERRPQRVEAFVTRPDLEPAPWNTLEPDGVALDGRDDDVALLPLALWYAEQAMARQDVVRLERYAAWALRLTVRWIDQLDRARPGLTHAALRDRLEAILWSVSEWTDLDAMTAREHLFDTWPVIDLPQRPSTAGATWSAWVDLSVGSSAGTGTAVGVVDLAVRGGAQWGAFRFGPFVAGGTGSVALSDRTHAFDTVRGGLVLSGVYAQGPVELEAGVPVGVWSRWIRLDRDAVRQVAPTFGPSVGAWLATRRSAVRVGLLAELPVVILPSAVAWSARIGISLGWTSSRR